MEYRTIFSAPECQPIFSVIVESRLLEITLISANDLKNVNLFSKMRVYAKASLSDDPKTILRTPADNTGRTNPNWNFNLKFTIDENLTNQNRLHLVFKLRCKKRLGNKKVGELLVPVKELLDNLGDGKSPQFVRSQVWRPSGKAQGILYFSYKFGDKVVQQVPYSPEQQGSSGRGIRFTLGLAVTTAVQAIVQWAMT